MEQDWGEQSDIRQWNASSLKQPLHETATNEDLLDVAVGFHESINPAHKVPVL